MGAMKQLELINITKHYPGCIANQGICLSVEAGEIHAILGENGAGKSTLMKIIYGVVKPDAGQMLWQDHEISVKGPAHARQLGIGMVFQHFSLFESLTVAENIALSLPKQGCSSLSELSRRIIQVSRQYGMELDPERKVYSLSIGEQQRVEIVRCLLQDIQLLILDEPTSVLTPLEVDSLFATLRLLADRGCSILFISHKLSEVQSLCDQATVLRGGKITGTCLPSQTSIEQMARLMVDEDTAISKSYPRAEGQASVLVLNQLSYQPEEPFAMPLKNISLDLRAGEILGIAGVAGNGQGELLKLLTGEYLGAAGEIEYMGEAIGKLPPGERRRRGIAVVPEERLGRGAVPNMSLAMNDLLTGYTCDLSRFGWLNWKTIVAHTAAILAKYRVKSDGPLAQAKSLSGGNLQKFIIGREISQQPDLLICSHPTWGVDIGAANLIRDELISLRDAGKAILVISEDIDELYQICDRLCAICHGSLSPIRNTDSVSINQLGQWMAGEFDTETPATPFQEAVHA